MQDQTIVRRFLLWWMGAPANPFVAVSFVVDFTQPRAYLERLSQAGGTKVTVLHLAAAALTRTMVIHPEANARIFGRKVLSRPHVGLFMPVNLLGHAGGASRELSASIIEQAQTHSLRSLAYKTTRSVAAEREGRIQNNFVRRLVAVLDRTPDEGLWRLLDGLDRAVRIPWLDQAFFELAPATTGITNVGSAFRAVEGLSFRGASLALPHRLTQVSTLIGISALQEEVLAVDGIPTVRTVLPCMCVFDHRVIDGVRASRVITTFGDQLLAPDAAFGADGGRLLSET